MNSKFLKILPVIALALVATTPLTQAKTYTPAQFNAELKKKVGTKKGAAAYNAAANFYKSALADKKNKSKAATYANYVVKLIKYPKVVPIALSGKSVNTFVAALQKGYFSAGVKYSFNDKTYSKALQVILKSLPSSQKANSVTSQLIYNTVKSAAKKSGATDEETYQFFTKEAKGYVEPPVS